MSQGGGQWRVGGALGGHYTDGSPQPLTNLDLVPVHVIIVMINTISDWILKAYFQVHIEANNYFSETMTQLQCWARVKKIRNRLYDN